MKLTFESDLRYRQEALKSITGLFAGQPVEKNITEYGLQPEYVALTHKTT